MAITAQQAIDVFRSWLGMSRKKGTHKPIVDIYNSYLPQPRGYRLTYTDDYCDGAVSAVFIKLNAVDLIGGIECGVEEHVSKFRKKGIWKEDGRIVPQPGDIIVYSWRKSTQPNNAYSDHIGMIEIVDKKNRTMTVIEGNTQGGIVGRRIVPFGWEYIRGFALPHYSKKEADSKIPEISENNELSAEDALFYDEKTEGTYETITDLWMRTGAGKEKTGIIVVPAGKKIHCDGYYNETPEQIKWLYVVYEDLKGYCSTRYLKVSD